MFFLFLPANWFDMLKTGVEYKGLVFTPGVSNGINIMPMQIFLNHGVERMHITLDQFCQEPDTLSNSKIVQSFG